MADDPASEAPGDGVEADPSGLADRVAELESDLDELDDQLEEMVQDVRDRVIQVKRETDAKAPIDHDHADLADRVDRIDDNVRALGRDYVDVDDDLARLEERIDAVDDRLDAGFSNYEDVLEYLIEATDELDDKLETLVRAVVDLRQRTERVASADAERGAVDRLRNAAQEHGVTEASCEDCGATIHLGLLTSPNCPGCGTEFGGVEPKTGFFGSATLQTGAQPALEGATVGESEELTGLLASEDEEAPTVGHGGSESGEAGLGDIVREPGADAPAEGAPIDRRPGDEPADGESGVPGDEHGTASGDERPTGDGAGALEVHAISGIGQAYSQRLADVGVETVGELALADPERLAGATDISRDRIDGWIDRARQMTELG